MTVHRFALVTPTPGRDPQEALRQLRAEIAPRLAAHRARRRRRLIVRAVLRGAWAYRGRAAAVVFLALYWLGMLGQFGMSTLLTLALSVSATLLCVAILALLRVQVPVEEPVPAVVPTGRFRAVVRCLIRQRHNPERYPLGGFRCIDCGSVGADLEEMGFDSGSGYVARRGEPSR